MKTYLYILMAIMLLCSSCDTIHEFPDEDWIDPTLVNLDIKVTFNINDLSNIAPESRSRSVSNDQCLRFIFEIYKNDQSKLPIMRRERTITQLNPHEAAINETFALNATQYYVLVWADYLNKNQASDQFYNTGSLYAISFIEPFISNTDNRDCFVGIANTDLTAYRDQWNAHIELTVPLFRPVAKYALIANDIDKYIESIQSKNPSRSAIDINSYTAVIGYPGYMPSSFNVQMNQPNDSRIGLRYLSTCRQLTDKEALICFDYPLVNGTKSQAKLKLQLYDNQGKLVNEIDDITFPIQRDSLTVVRSNYFTQKYSPGININPDYEGSIDIILPD